MSQTLDFYAANVENAPVIMYFHPNSTNSHILVGSLLYQTLVQPALDAGFAVVTVEFRHPVVNQDQWNSPTDSRVPHWDAARAIQWVRANAQFTGIDKRNLFVVGHSRGTLSLWTALQPDFADLNSPDPISHESTHALAALGYQAQTMYNGLEFDSLYLVPSDVPQADADFIAANPPYQQFGSDIDSVNSTSLPVMLRYQDSFIPYQISYAYMQTLDYIHYPDFGITLCSKYQQLATAPCSANDLVTPDHAYDGMIQFFKQYLVK
jgi:hypothetical protein